MILCKNLCNSVRKKNLKISHSKITDKWRHDINEFGNKVSDIVDFARCHINVVVVVVVTIFSRESRKEKKECYDHYEITT